MRGMKRNPLKHKKRVFNGQLLMKFMSLKQKSHTEIVFLLRRTGDDVAWGDDKTLQIDCWAINLDTEKESLITINHIIGNEILMN